MILKITFDNSWNIDIDVHYISDEHVDNSEVVYLVVLGKSLDDFLVVIASLFLITLFDVFFLLSESILIPSLLYVSEFLQINLRLLFDRFELGCSKRIKEYGFTYFSFWAFLTISLTSCSAAMSLCTLASIFYLILFYK